MPEDQGLARFPAILQVSIVGVAQAVLLGRHDPVIVGEKIQAVPRYPAMTPDGSIGIAVQVRRMRSSWISFAGE